MIMAVCHAEALVLTHELALGTYDPYLSEVLWPLRPLLCFGRSAKAFPTCPAKHAVMCWWREPLGSPREGVR